jgi:hypothetical protein
MTSMLLGLWMGVALGQTTSFTETYGIAVDNDNGDWTDCQNHQSIAGTAGFENARAANETNALVYGAAGYLHHTVLPMLNEARKLSREQGGGWHGGGGFRYSTTLQAAVVPTYESSGGCPDRLRISERPLELGSTNLGIAASNGTFGLFYTASVVYGYTPSFDPRERFLYGMSGYVGGAFGAVLAPLAGRDQAFGEGASAVRTDFVVGGIADLPGVHARAGWVGSRGVYADLEADIPVFVSAVIDEPSLSNLLQGGLRRLKLGDGVGHLSLYAKNQPLRPVPEVAAGGTGFREDATGGLNFLAGHFAQERIAGLYEVRVAYAVRPQPLLHEAQVGIRSPNGSLGSRGVDYLLRGGVVSLPDLWFYGVQGGMKPTLRGEIGVVVSDDGNPAGGSIRYLVMTNDPEQLLLFPYAYGAWTMGVTFDGRF